jgi:hypothetical protein
MTPGVISARSRRKLHPVSYHERVFPYHDENETQRTPIVTIILIVLNVGAWLFVQGA